MSRFLQIHTLTSYPAALLNRDDQGFAKCVPFGSAVRTRVSSQCLKRHWRTHAGAHALSEISLPETLRSRHTFERLVARPLLDERKLDEEKVRAVAEKVMDELGMAKAKKKEALQTGQVTVLGRPEVEFLRELVANLVAGLDTADAKAVDAKVKEALGKEGRQNLKRLGEQAGMGLSAALFGRMVTSDLLARTDAAIHVAHAFTVHEQQNEADYFSAIDDLERDEGELGSGHIGNVDLTSGLYYGYVVVDLPLLRSNLGGDPAVSGEVVERLVWLVCTVSPGAKLGSTAPYAHAQALVVESGDTQPRTLANAFLDPIRGRGDVLAQACERLTEHVGDLDRMYGPSTVRRVASTRRDFAVPAATVGTVADAAAFAKASAGGA
jgi:CRISPR system Cascade subunit CasC